VHGAEHNAHKRKDVAERENGDHGHPRGLGHSDDHGEAYADRRELNARDKAEEKRQDYDDAPDRHVPH